MELKRGLPRASRGCRRSINRTFMELKQGMSVPFDEDYRVLIEPLWN